MILLGVARVSILYLFYCLRERISRLRTETDL
jgi:hypothetical protein